MHIFACFDGLLLFSRFQCYSALIVISQTYIFAYSEVLTRFQWFSDVILRRLLFDYDVSIIIVVRPNDIDKRRRPIIQSLFGRPEDKEGL